jgi:hypothetical protein
VRSRLKPNVLPAVRESDIGLGSAPEQSLFDAMEAGPVQGQHDETWCEQKDLLGQEPVLELPVLPNDFAPSVGDQHAAIGTDQKEEVSGAPAIVSANGRPISAQLFDLPSEVLTQYVSDSGHGGDNAPDTQGVRGSMQNGVGREFWKEGKKHDEE